MSYVVHVFSERETPLLKEELKAELERQGYLVAFYAGAHREERIVSDTGPLDSDTTVIACEATSESAAPFQFLTEADDVPALREMINAFEAEWCDIYPDLPYNISQSWGDEDIEELLENGQVEYVEALRRAKSEYSLTTNLHFLDFMEIVWRTVGIIVGGMIEDPQQDILEFVTAKGN